MALYEAKGSGSEVVAAEPAPAAEVGPAVGGGGAAEVLAGNHGFTSVAASSQSAR